MKKKLFFILIILTLLITGCKNKENQVISNGKPINTKDMIHEHCTRLGSIDDGDVSLNYEIYYTGEVLNLISSEEKVISANEEILNTYEDAYRKIHSHYEGLEYYDTEVIRTDTTVTSKMVINYDKIDTNKLLEIEGAEDNIFENGVAKIAKWKELAKKFGTTCEVVGDSF